MSAFEEPDPACFGFVSTDELDGLDGRRARVPPTGSDGDGVVGGLEDYGDTFSVGDSEFLKSEHAFVAVEGVDCDGVRTTMPIMYPRSGRWASDD